MPIDMDDAMRGGHVSARAAKRHVGVRGPRPKGAEMTTPKRLDEGKSKGTLGKGHIDTRSLQHTVKGMPSKGGGVGAKDTPGAKYIDKFPAGKGKSWSAESSVRGKPGQGVPNPRSKGVIRPQGGQYGGGGRDTQ